MNRQPVILGVIVLALLVARQALAQDILPYASVELQEFPAATAVADLPAEQLEARFPDYDASALVSTSYYEEAAHGGRTLGVLTVVADREVCLSLIYYSPAGRAYVIRNSLPLSARSNLTSTFQLPAAEPDGLTRLLLWDAGFDASWVVFLARHPAQELEPVPGLLAQAWFGRSEPGPNRYPWEDPYRPQSVFSSDFHRGEDPDCMVRLGADGRQASKDCTVRGTAPVRISSDEYGILGLWDLDWSSRLSVTFELPPSGPPAAAYLVVYGVSGHGFGVATDPSVEVTVNGWAVVPTMSISPFQASLQPIALDVSQYLAAGPNEITLQLSALADRIWKVSRVELWLE